MKTLKKEDDRRRHRIIKILLKARLPFATLVIGILLIIFLTTYISPMMATHDIAPIHL